MDEKIAMLEDNSFFTGKDIIRYRPAIAQIKKGTSHLRPLFEAFTNAWESFGNNFNDSSFIRITLDVFNEELDTETTPIYRFHQMIVEDNGVGFNNENFERFKCLNDNTKGNSNKGTGRIQYIHVFDMVDFISVFEYKNSFYERSFSLSASEDFLRNNAILYYKTTIKTDKTLTGTKIIFTNPKYSKDADFYANRSIQELKQEILKKFILLFCSTKGKIPIVQFSYIVNGKETERDKIDATDIPHEEKSFVMTASYKEKRNNEILNTGLRENISVRSFKIDANQLDNNQIILAAKGESVDSNITLCCLTNKDVINGNRYLFLLESQYFNNKVTENRGKIEILTEEEFKKQDLSLFDSEVLLRDDIETEVNNQIIDHFPEIRERQKDIKKNIEELKNMFLLNTDALKQIKFSINDDDKDILAKVYKYDSDVLAKRDALLKKQINNLKGLSTSAPDYEEKLTEQVNKLVEEIPLQNRTALTQYVARRQLILQEFDLILHRKLECQKKELGGNSELIRNKDEKLLHNLIFQQKSTDTLNSALWILNEEFIYFDGISESRLCDVELNGEKIFKQDITEKEEEYLHMFGEYRDHLRPDVLLFPAEGKAIIIEFKAPDVNPSKYVTQVQNYASLLLNYSQQKYKLTTFYGYLIGENIDARDVRHNYPYFVDAPNFDYIYEPAQPVINDDGGKDGSIYTEVLKYSILLEKAKLRNQIYKKKLGIDIDEIKDENEEA